MTRHVARSLAFLIDDATPYRRGQRPLIPNRAPGSTLGAWLLVGAIATLAAVAWLPLV
jgi:hypothetical protein